MYVSLLINTPWRSLRVFPLRTVLNTATGKGCGACFVRWRGVTSTPLRPISMNAVDGVARLRLPLSHEERMFIFNPTENVSEVIKAITGEVTDGRKVNISVDGAPVASHTKVTALLQSSFQVHVGEDVFEITPPLEVKMKSELSGLEDVRQTVQRLYEALDIEESKKKTVVEIEKQLAALEAELEPMQAKFVATREQAEKRTRLMVWGGLAAMGFQWGLLARLTFWEYSWDIVEPLTYFITFATAMGSYVFFALTRSDYEYRGAFDRKYVQYLHRSAQNHKLDIEQYNNLLESVEQTKEALRRLQQR